MKRVLLYQGSFLLAKKGKTPHHYLVRGYGVGISDVFATEVASVRLLIEDIKPNTVRYLHKYEAASFVVLVHVTTDDKRAVIVDFTNPEVEFDLGIRFATACGEFVYLDLFRDDVKHSFAEHSDQVLLEVFGSTVLTDHLVTVGCQSQPPLY
jgi:hypothetical protein